MDRIYIIGNGFDCAHQLPTRYIDFITWYIADCFRVANEQKDFDNVHFNIIKRTDSPFNLGGEKNLKDFEKFRTDIKRV